MTSQAEVVFRREWGRAVAVVTRLTGDLGLAEDAVQEAFASAVGRWTGGPLPSDPSGWLITVAKITPWTGSAVRPGDPARSRPRC